MSEEYIEAEVPNLQIEWEGQDDGERMALHFNIDERPRIFAYTREEMVGLVGFLTEWLERTDLSKLLNLEGFNLEPGDADDEDDPGQWAAPI